VAEQRGAGCPGNRRGSQTARQGLLGSGTKRSLHRLPRQGTENRGMSPYGYPVSTIQPPRLPLSGGSRVEEPVRARGSRLEQASSCLRLSSGTDIEENLTPRHNDSDFQPGAFTLSLAHLSTTSQRYRECARTIIPPPMCLHRAQAQVCVAGKPTTTAQLLTGGT
jgi:hypothetical protein